MFDVYYVSDCDRKGLPTHPAPGRWFQMERYEVFEDGFAFLQAKTGGRIDEYCIAKLYPTDQWLLREYWSDSTDAEVRKFVVFLDESIRNDEVLLIEGD